MTVWWCGCENNEDSYLGERSQILGYQRIKSLFLIWHLNTAFLYFLSRRRRRNEEDEEEEKEEEKDQAAALTA